MNHNSYQGQKTRPISKSNNNYNNQNGKNNKPHKPYRPTFNNNNPHNKLILNEFHQIIDQKHNYSNKKPQHVNLHKRKRDLQRIIKHCKQKGIEVDETKQKQLKELQQQLNGRRRKYEKDKRKQYFLEQKYKDVKRIELRKVYKHLGQTKANPQMSQQQKKEQINQWQKKLRYIKHFPKTLKYISLFPSNKPLEQKTLQFQKKIMNDIEQENKKRVERLNFYKSQNEVKESKKIKAVKGEEGQEDEKKRRRESVLPKTVRQIKTDKGNKLRKKVVDDFFMVDEEQGSDGVQNNEQGQQQDQEQENIERQVEQEQQEESQNEEQIQQQDVQQQQQEESQS